MDPRQSTRQESSWLLEKQGCQTLGKPSKWTDVTPRAHESQPPQLSWLVGKRILASLFSSVLHICFFWMLEGSVLLTVVCAEAKNPLSFQGFRQFTWELELNFVTEMLIFKFLFQIGTKSNCGFQTFLSKTARLSLHISIICCDNKW